MKKSLGSIGELFPQSVFIVATYDEEGTPNAMNAAWAGACARREVALNIGSHKTTQTIVAKGAFTVSPATADLVVESDYFGWATGSEVNKAEGSKLTFSKSENVDAPVIEEYPLTMECVVKEVQGDENGARVIGEIVNVLADEEVLDGDGVVDFGRIGAIVYDSSRRAYRQVGGIVAGAWDAGKPLM